MYSQIYNKISAPRFLLSVMMFLTFLLDYKVVSKIEFLGHYYVYSLKAIPFFLLPICIYSFKKNISTYVILGFWFLYSYAGFFQTFSIDTYSKYFFSVSWYFVSCSIITIAALGLEESQEIGSLIAKFMFYSGAAFFVLQIFTENELNRFFDFPLMLVIGSLFFLRRHLTLYLLLSFFILSTYLFSVNRTGIIVVLICIISQSKFLVILDGAVAKLWALGLAFLLTLFFASNEAIDLFNHSLLSGRGAIWSYWLNIIQSDPLFLLFGVRYTGVIYDSYVIVGNHQLAPLLAYQFHSALIATLVQGGLFGLLLTLSFIACMFLGSKVIGLPVFYYSSLAVMSLNGVNDFFSPNFYGLIFLISIVMGGRGRGSKFINIVNGRPFFS